MDVSVAMLTLLAGIGVFLIACTMVSNNLESVCSDRLKSLFSRISDNKLAGVGIGAVGTAAIQSSGATTVLVIGFVNTGIMSLTLAAAVIYGANIGTTITAQIVALGMFGDGTLTMTVIFSALAGVGAFVSLFAKKDFTKKMGAIIAGFGLLFVGLEMMSGSMSDFAELDSVKEFLAGIKNVIVLVLVGAGLTAIIQSSSVMTSVAIAMLFTGLIDLEQGIYLTMGSNIGSCVVAILAALSGGLNAKRTALIHLLFNVIGVIIFVTAGFVMGAVTGGSTTFATIFESLFPGIPQTQLAMFHTIFNVITVIIMLPLTSRLISLVTRVLPEKGEPNLAEDGPRLYYINNYMLRTPSIAILEVKNEIVNMSRIAMENFHLSCEMARTLDFSRRKEFDANEEELDFLNKELTHFLVKLSNTDLNSRDNMYVSTSFHTISDLERVGDYAENIVEYVSRLERQGEDFSEGAKKEIEEAENLVTELYERILYAYVNEDEAALEEAYEIEERIDEATDKMSETHIHRLNEGTCSIAAGTEFLALASDTERIADHLINMGKMIREYRVKPEPVKRPQETAS
ncbi:MAG: Na/Pi cotransporter family protein [Candidatus Methanomethylophilaceae archaeon]|nr:Na/Pi cotransporter family protein [Candidatus Methanomethylophilaceae archaeon]